MGEERERGFERGRKEEREAGKKQPFRFTVYVI